MRHSSETDRDPQFPFDHDPSVAAAVEGGPEISWTGVSADSRGIFEIAWYGCSSVGSANQRCIMPLWCAFVDAGGSRGEPDSAVCQFLVTWNQGVCTCFALWSLNILVDLEG